MIERVLAAREELELQCELVYLRSLMTVAARDRDEEALRSLRPQLAQVGMDLVRRRDEDRDGPMGRLADRFSISDDELECLWSIVAVSCDPRFAITLDALWPGRRGLPIAAYAHVRGTSAVIGRDLARWLATANPLVTSGLVGVVDALPIAARSYTASARLIAHLAGDDEPADGVARIERPGALLVDDAGQRVLAELAKLLAGPPVAIVIEGPRASGRSTAIAASTERTVVELDVSTTADLSPIAREAALDIAIPIIANIDALAAIAGAASVAAGARSWLWRAVPAGSVHPMASNSLGKPQSLSRCGCSRRFWAVGARCASWSDANAGVHRRDRGWPASGARRCRVDSEFRGGALGAGRVRAVRQCSRGQPPRVIGEWRPRRASRPPGAPALLASDPSASARVGTTLPPRWRAPGCRPGRRGSGPPGPASSTAPVPA